MSISRKDCWFLSLWYDHLYGRKVNDEMQWISLNVQKYFTSFLLPQISAEILSFVTRYLAFIVLVCLGPSQMIPLSVLAWNPHKWPVHKTGSEWGKVWERAKGQSAEGPRRKQSGDESQAERRPVNRSQKGSCSDLLTHRGRVN